MSTRLIGEICRQINDIAADQRQHHGNLAVTRVGMCGMGEPLLRPESVRQVIRSIGDDVQLVLVTNGAALTPELVDDPLLDRLDQITLSMAGYGASYERVYNLKFDDVWANLVAAAQRRPGRVAVSIVHSPFVDDDDAQRLRADLDDLGVEYVVAALHSRGGHLAHPSAYPGPTRDFTTCRIFTDVTFVSSDGEVLSCCHDVQSVNVIGDLRLEALRSVMSRKYKLRQQISGFAICAGCTDFSIS